MKSIAAVLVLAVVAVSAKSINEFEEFDLPVDIPVDDQIWFDLRNELLKGANNVAEDGHIVANVTKYAQRILTRVRVLIIQLGMDPMSLDNEYIGLFPIGFTNLTNGWLQDLSNINVSDSVLASYSLTTHVLNIRLPLYFEKLQITYDYHTVVTLLSIKGNIDANIDHFKLDLNVGFNFTSLYAFVDDADVTNTGQISVVITGLGLLDWIVEAMTDVIIAFLHGLILKIVNLVIHDPVQAVVDDINSLIDLVLRRNTTSLM